MIEVRSPDAERLARELDQAKDDLPEAIHDADVEAAKRTADQAAARATSLGGLPAHVAPALIAEDRTVVLESGGQWEMAPGAEYGRDRYTVHPYRGGGDNAGYFLTPTIRDDEDTRHEVYEAAAEHALRKVT